MLQFEPLSSQIDPTFWTHLSKLKIDILKQDDKELDIHSTFNPGSLVFLNHESFERGSLPGVLHNTNTIEDFKSLDKQAFLSRMASRIWNAIGDPSILKQPNQMALFALISFADIKKYKFYYWACFPCLLPMVPYELESLTTVDKDLTQYNRFVNRYPQHALFFLYKNDAFAPLSDWESFYDDSCMIGFLDPSLNEKAPGWPLRNYLLMIQRQFKLTKVSVLCLRQKGTSLILNVTMPLFSSEFPKHVGWEKGILGKPAPRVIDLAPLMDPNILAATAVDLNLKLMRWRILPDLDLEKVAGAKCLLLGAGTLGSYVARGLLGWGVRNIDFVDNGKVSFSNPDSTGHEFSIPMPGHVADSPNSISNQTGRLESLIAGHDVIFLLTDSRESRWLPTLLGSYHNKLVINAALGFDSFLVMRHGMRNEIPSKRLGCYFCNDVVAPVDSLSERPLDQQCTVTRPGLSGIAAGLAVDASCLEDDESVLGKVPHQIRGSLGQFTNTVLTGRAYDKCTACSPAIIDAYRQRGHAFVLEAIQKPKTLEEITGLTTLHATDVDVEWDEE
ncbi:hypothetical protein EDD86DRAFT_246442 [Gorgonomyces haynaldii]|nr:hypothetical protein EDD86DRAFT_246442 [Gorgonomyces haynaldii]